MKCIAIIIIFLTMSFIIYPISALSHEVSINQDKNVSKNATITEISVPELNKLINSSADEYILIDVRTPQEYAKQHLDKAININLFGASFEKEIEKLPRDKNIILYCQSGRRSESAGVLIKEKGFKKVSHLKGGLNLWNKNINLKK